MAPFASSASSAIAARANIHLERGAERLERAVPQPHAQERIGVGDDLARPEHRIARLLRRIDGGLERRVRHLELRPLRRHRRPRRLAHREGLFLLSHRERLLFRFRLDLGLDLDELLVRDRHRRRSLCDDGRVHRLLVDRRHRLAHLLGARGQLLDARIVRRLRLQVGDDLDEQLGSALILGLPSHLLLDLDRLRPLADDDERAREQTERLDVLRVRLEADLQLREREHPVVGLPAREVHLRGETCEADLGAVVEQALEDLERVVVPAELDEDVGRDRKLLDRAVGVLHARQRLREPQVRQRIGRIELDELAEDVDRVAIAPRLLQPRRDLVVRRERIGHETELRVQLRELRNDVSVTVLEVRNVLVDDLADLLVDGDRLERETLLRVVLADALVRRDRFRVGLELRLQIADLQQGPSVVRILLDDLLVLRDRLVVLLLRDVRLGGLEHLLAVDRHSRSTPQESGPLALVRSDSARASASTQKLTRSLHERPSERNGAEASSIAQVRPV
jgi:hypothetical protein